MPVKRKYLEEDQPNDAGYADVECPECSATINTHFTRGRSWRKLQCPVCQKQVTVSIENEPSTLIQLQQD